MFSVNKNSLSKKYPPNRLPQIFFAKKKLIEKKSLHFFLLLPIFIPPDHKSMSQIFSMNSPWLIFDNHGLFCALPLYTRNRSKNAQIPHLQTSEEKWVLEEGAPFCIRHMTKSPVLSPTKSASSAQQSPLKGKSEPLKTIHIDTTSCFDSSDASSVQSPSGSSQFSPISPIKKNVTSPKKTPVQSPKKQ